MRLGQIFVDSGIVTEKELAIMDQGKEEEVVENERTLEEYVSDIVDVISEKPKQVKLDRKARSLKRKMDQISEHDAHLYHRALFAELTEILGVGFSMDKHGKKIKANLPVASLSATSVVRPHLDELEVLSWSKAFSLRCMEILEKYGDKRGAKLLIYWKDEK